MQYKINEAIRIRYLAISLETGLTDLKLIITKPDGSDLSPVILTELGDGLYETTFTPDTTGWYWARINSVLKPRNVYSKSYFVGATVDNKIETTACGRGKCSTLNSTQTLLDIGETFIGTWEEILDYSMLNILILSDQASATDGLVIEWSCDGSMVEQTDEFSILANKGKTFSFGMIGKYFRVKYTNGSVAQSLFRLQALLKPFNQKASSHRITDNAVGEDDAELVKAILTGKSDSNFINVKVSPEGRLEVENIPSKYITKSLSEIVDITIPVTTDYWILNLSNTIGVIEEFHIITDNNLFLFKINVDGVNYFDESGTNLDAQYFLTPATLTKNIGTNASGTQLHWTLPIYFESSIQIGIYHPTLATKKLKAYIILYKTRT